MHDIRAEFWLPVSIEKVWEFFSDATRLAKISPRFLGLAVKGDSQTVEGNTIHLEFHPLSLPVALKWDSLIDDLRDTEMTKSFVDIQSRGFFKSWKHTHTFQAGAKSIGKIPISKNGTWCLDRVQYELPMDFMELGNNIFVNRALGAMFAHRKKALYEHFQCLSFAD